MRSLSEETLQEQGPDTDVKLRDEERWPFYSSDEIEAAISVLRSGNVNQWTGPEVFAFEKMCGTHFGGQDGIALANGSVALELALRALGIGPGDEVIVTPRSFVASAFCVMLVGARPIFADVDPASGNITSETIRQVLTPRTKAVVPVHLAGWPADMPAIMALAANHGIFVIEDCAQAHGAEIDGRSVGSFGDAATFSFCQDKIISTGGEGGFASFRDEAAFQWAWSFKDHGKNINKERFPKGQSGVFRWLHDQVGTNWRLTGIQAAIGLVQLRKLGEWTALRGRNAAIWSEALRDVPGLRLPSPGPRLRHAFYKFYFYLEAESSDAAAARAQIIERSAAAGLRVFSGSCSEMYLEKAFHELPKPHCPVAHELSSTSLMVEVHPTLNPELLRLRARRLADIVRSVISSGTC